MQGGASSGYDTDDDASVGQHSDALSVEAAADSATTCGGRRSSCGASSSRPEAGAQSPLLRGLLPSPAAEEEERRRATSLPNQATHATQEALRAHPLLHTAASDEAGSSGVLGHSSGSVDLDAAVAAAAASGSGLAWPDSGGGGLHSEISLAKDVDLRGQPSLDAECGCPPTAAAAAAGRAGEADQALSFTVTASQAVGQQQNAGAALCTVAIPEHGTYLSATVAQPVASGELTATSLCTGVPASQQPAPDAALQEPPTPSTLHTFLAFVPSAGGPCDSPSAGKLLEGGGGAFAPGGWQEEAEEPDLAALRDGGIPNAFAAPAGIPAKAESASENPLPALRPPEGSAGAASQSQLILPPARPSHKVRPALTRVL